MKKRLVLSLSLFMALASVSPAQERNSLLVDKFQNPGCEDLWARLDGFLIQLNSNPEAIATVAVSGKVGQLRDDLWTEDMIRRYFLTRNVPSHKWKLVRTRPETERRIEFWLTPTGAEAPKIEPAEWSLEYPRRTKPFIFASYPNYAEEVSVCLSSNELRLLAQILQANPAAHTNVVLVVRSQRAFAKKQIRTISELINVYGIPRRQIRIFKRITRRSNPYHIEPDVEYWLVP